MKPSTPLEQRLLLVFMAKGPLRSSALHEEMLRLGETLSLITIKRALSGMTLKGMLKVTGGGRSTSYTISSLGRIEAPVDAKTYCAEDPDRRYGLARYNFDLFSSLPRDLFTADQNMRLRAATKAYDQRTRHLPEAIRKKELERLIIELSWKSSKIEGNTYTLLDTEKLILENKEAPGHDRMEAVMILNHKRAFQFILKERARYTTLSRANLEELHKQLIKNLGVGIGLRRKPVGVTGSLYQPLDNLHQIREAVEELSAAISRITSPYGKALAALLGISYIQPFDDGNKRTGRLMANALLLAHRCAPLSYRSVEENEYREAALVFYELNSIIPFRDIFVTQYEFAAKNYAVK